MPAQPLDLLALLAEPSSKRALAESAAALVDREVAARSGVSGIALKAGYRTVLALRPAFVREALEHLMPLFAPSLQQHIARANAEHAALATYFSDHASAIADDLLAVTDARIESADQRSLKSTYAALRGQAHKQTSASMPALGLWLATYPNTGE